MYNKLLKEVIEADLRDVFEENSPTRRFFRCYLDGSYYGEQDYRNNVEYLEQYKANKKKLRSFVVFKFTKYMADDTGCSYGYAQKVIVNTIPKEKLEALNEELIEDALDLIA
mgnify:FL=1